MANRTRNKPQLPKSVLDMKFMRKTKDRIEKELQNTQYGGLYASSITNEMRQASGNYISESSFIFCEDLVEGRLSFKGMNPDIERLMELDKKQDEPEEDMQKDISDELLAKKMAAFHKRKRPTDSPSRYNVVKKKKV